MPQPGSQLDRDIIDLLSDSESEGRREVPNALSDAQIIQQDVKGYSHLDGSLMFANDHHHFNHGEIIDLTTIPDADIPPTNPTIMTDEARSTAAFDNLTSKGQYITEDECVRLVLDVLPDISVSHLLSIIRRETNDATRTTTQCQMLLTDIIDGGEYPKEADMVKGKKRKRGDDDFSEYERGEPDPELTDYQQDALDILKDEFLSVPLRHITNILREHKTLFKAYGIIEEQLHNYRQVATPFSKIHRSRPKRGIEFIMIERGSKLPKELHAAKRKREMDLAKCQKAKDFELAEKANLQQAEMNNEMGECVCCFNDVPLNRMINCDGAACHLYCLQCPRQQIETQMGQSCCRPKCFGVQDCDGTFTRAHLQQVLSERTFERLEHMQQQEDLKAAGLDFLSECPFCDFKMECPPVEVDKEFRCENQKCGKTSCRLCQRETHIPLSCREIEVEQKKDKQLTLRHIVEEAMSNALIRHCNRCKHAFIKEFGCNKMTCSHCRNMQCYICSKDVINYDHFGEAARGKCPLHENVEDRHEQEVKRAADEAMAKVCSENPELSGADLMVKVSDRVKQAEDARLGRAARGAYALPNPNVPGYVDHNVPMYRNYNVPIYHNHNMPEYQNRLPPVPMAGGQPVVPFVPARPPHLPVHMGPIAPPYAPQPPPHPMVPGLVPGPVYGHVPFLGHPAQALPPHMYAAPAPQALSYPHGNQHGNNFVCPRCFRNHPPNQPC